MKRSLFLFALFLSASTNVFSSYNVPKGLVPSYNVKFHSDGYQLWTNPTLSRYQQCSGAFLSIEEAAKWFYNSHTCEKNLQNYPYDGYGNQLRLVCYEYPNKEIRSKIRSEIRSKFNACLIKLNAATRRERQMKFAQNIAAGLKNAAARSKRN
jgi:hypothetical protein